jgi:agmatine deiminase
MLWPERTDIWRLGAKPAQRVFAEIANTLAEFEDVVVGVKQSQYENARHRLSERIRVVEISYDDAWIRDTGPTFLVNGNGATCGIDWFFNAWGGIARVTDAGQWNLTGSYFPWKLDDLVARKVLEIEGVRRYRCPLILEGGAIHVDGEGTLLATKECIRGRNPDLTLSQIEDILSRHLGIDNFVWLARGLFLEENSGHIDNMCCFADARTILMNWCDDASDPQYEISLEAFDILSEAKNARGESYTVVKVFQPPTLFITEEESSSVDSSEYAIPRLPNSRLPASYINSYPCNGAILIPSFATQFDERPRDSDAAALKVYRDAFVGREVVQIPARELLLGGGGIHCVVQQVPKCSS